MSDEIKRIEEDFIDQLTQRCYEVEELGIVESKSRYTSTRKGRIDIENYLKGCTTTYRVGYLFWFRSGGQKGKPLQYILSQDLPEPLIQKAVCEELLASLPNEKTLSLETLQFLEDEGDSDAQHVPAVFDSAIL